ncbi:MAG: IS481 family transposase [Chloroflexi bacterium]|jgi:putative transposase|nr:MAG: IS481 family transposase [Chloroflexota bacterium]
MPWKESTAMDERCRFARSYLTGAYQMSELCAWYRISRPTGYKWVERYDRGGQAAMAERSRAPHRCPHRMSPALQTWFIQARRQYGWGARKLLKIFRNQHPRRRSPSRTAICELFKRQGLAQGRRRATRRRHGGGPRVAVSAPNQLWTIDFKGHFRTGDHRWCYPLTLMDQHSRYLLLCRGQLDCSAHPAEQRIRQAFRQYGLPARIHSDNGAPFASGAIAGLSQMSVQWLKLGIRIERSRPACPQDNGAHERLHRTLKEHATRPAAKNLRAQQRRFSVFLREYNELRPHESLNDHPPAKFYQPSPRAYPARIPKPQYPEHFEVRRVSHNGYVKWRAQAVFVSLALANEDIAFEQIDEALWSLHFYHQLLGRFDAQTRKLIPL